METTRTINDLMSGATIACMAMIGLCFLRFHRRTRDRLFLLFAWAFWILAINRIALTLWRDEDGRTYLYLVRLAAYLLILGAIWDKNRAREHVRAPAKSSGLAEDR
jgi:hypothetical protein